MSGNVNKSIFVQQKFACFSSEGPFSTSLVNLRKKMSDERILMTTTWEYLQNAMINSGIASAHNRLLKRAVNVNVPVMFLLVLQSKKY